MKYKGTMPELECKIKSSLYVDDLVAGANNLENAMKFYKESRKIMSEVGMNLCK